MRPPTPLPCRSPIRRRRFARGPTRVGSLRQNRLRDDLAQAHKIQRGLLPRVPESYHGVHMRAAYRPADEIGGDFYDWIELDDHRFEVIIGDVSGHGVAAALMMSRISAEFQSITRQGLSPDEILVRVNRFLFDNELAIGFVTAMCVEVDQRVRSLRVGNAGHLPLIARSKRTGKTWMCGKATGAALGLVEDESYSCSTCYFDPGDIVVLVTDGITEAIEPNADPSAGVLAGIIADADHDVSDVRRRILDAVRVASNGATPDDVTLFAMELT